VHLFMFSSVAVIAEFRGPIMDNMHTRLNAPSVAMCMEQMDPIWLHQNEMWEYMIADDES